MLTINRLQIGEGMLQYFDPEVGRAHQRRNMDDDARHEKELNFHKTLYTMADWVEKLFSRLEKLEKARDNASEGQGSRHGDNGGYPPPSPPVSEISSSSSHHHHRNSGNASNKHFFKLNVKFYLPMYNDKSNAEKLNNWIRQLELYCRIQQILEDEAKIQLASLSSTKWHNSHLVGEKTSRQQ